MKTNFLITGIFYERDGFQFRKVLHIKHTKTDLSQPDLMVIMMNPGASQPIDGIYNEFKEVEAIPDKTQEQIIKLMTNCGFHYTRILNLSDLKDSNSRSLLKLISHLDSKNIPHSIFDSRRSTELKQYYTKGIPTIFAWGVHSHLSPLAKLALTHLEIERPIGIPKKDSDFGFYHPLPPNYHKQLLWLEQITEQLEAVLLERPNP
ncbi:MAG: DUF1643 domain-containing protein [Psychroserpens sp.]|nr:DUF1643 domain-containing protein [Psychroserpens sp.]